MQIYNADIDIDLLEFCDRFGRIRSTSGCSFKGKVEFDARMKILANLLKKYEGETIGAIYLKDRDFEHNCDRALKLNGINPKWLTEAHLTELLFLHKEKAGALVLLNRANNPSGETQSLSESEGGNLYHQFLGAMYNFSQDPEQAFRLTEERPFKEVAGMIESLGKRNYHDETPNNQKSEQRSPEPQRRREISDRSRLELMALREKTRQR